MIAAALVIVLLALAALHFYWGAGGRWPGHDDRSLVELIVGRTRNMKAPGFWPSLFVAGCLAASAVLIALQAGAMAIPSGLNFVVALGFWTAFAVFFARGVAGFIPAIFRYAEGTPFARLNVRYYSPLCLLIAAGFLAVHFTAAS
jgi:hypothetical protein